MNLIKCKYLLNIIKYSIPISETENTIDKKVRFPFRKIEILNQEMYNLFHVLANYGRKVIDSVRVDAANQLKDCPTLRKVVKGSRYLSYKRPEDLS